jgi:tartrate dehydratase beta subunit/fumarate hydratase class I family protein
MGFRSGEIGRQVQKCGAFGFDSFLSSAHFVGKQIVHNDDIAWIDLGDEHMFNISQKSIPIHGSVGNYWGDQASERKPAMKVVV